MKYFWKTTQEIPKRASLGGGEESCIEGTLTTIQVCIFVLLEYLLNEYDTLNKKSF